ncbi:hypothetical protein MTO96_025864 [Rhipicephalus appendiculatus]
MATRLTNPFDSDRAGRVTPVTECTPAVAALLTPTQPQQSMEADAADMDNIDSWQWDLEPAEPEEARPSQSNTSTQCAADEPVASVLQLKDLGSRGLGNDDTGSPQEAYFMQTTFIGPRSIRPPSLHLLEEDSLSRQPQPHGTAWDLLS